MIIFIFILELLLLNNEDKILSNVLFSKFLINAISLLGLHDKRFVFRYMACERSWTLW